MKAHHPGVPPRPGTPPTQIAGAARGGDVLFHRKAAALSLARGDGGRLALIIAA